jgi:BASS family bile acid:Na+ symporter
MPKSLVSVALVLVGLVLLSAVAFWWPAASDATASAWPPNPFLATSRWLFLLIIVTMLAIGMMLPVGEVVQVLRRWPMVFAGTAIQYVTMPLLALLVGRAWGLEGSLLLGVAVVGCVPGAMASNVLTMNARGNTSYSVSLTTTATLVSPIMVPAMLWLVVGHHLAEDTLKRMAIDLLWTVVLPVVIGHLLRRRSAVVQRWAPRLAPLTANLAILWIIAVTVAQSKGDLVRASTSVWLPLLVINLGGYLAGYVGGRLMRLPEPMRRALTLEVGMQNAGLGVVLATRTLHDPLAAVPPAMFTFGCMLTGTILACVWSATPVPAPDMDERINLHTPDP